MRRATTLCILAAIIILSLASTAAADIVILKSGGRIEGEVIDRGDSVVVRINENVSTTIPRKEIKEIIIQKSPIRMYEEKARDLDDDDTLGHYALGLWCLDQGLTREAKIEFQKVIETDPEHEGARKKLGHEKIDGKWLTREELMIRNGFVKYRGQWLKKEEAEKRRQKDELEKNIREMVKEIEKSKGVPPLDVIEKLSKIADPAGLQALTKALKSRSEDVRAAVAESLGLIGNKKPGKTLFKLALDDKSKEVRAAAAVAMDKICKRTGKFELINKTIQTMFKQGAPKQREAAAEALGSIGDRRYITYLIKALVVNVKVRDKSGDESDPFGGGITSGTGRSRVGGKGWRVGGKRTSGGISVGPLKDKHKIVPKENPKALAALKKITGQDFGYDQKVWKEWHLMELERLAEEQEDKK